jgi:hypothetical protein
MTFIATDDPEHSPINLEYIVSVNTDQNEASPRGPIYWIHFETVKYNITWMFAEKDKRDSTYEKVLYHLGILKIEI